MDGPRNTRTLGSALAAFLLTIISLSCIAASEDPPFTGIVNGKDANLRAGANLNYEVVTQVQKGDVLYVAGKWMQWYKVRCPEGTLLWASAEFIQDGKVIANRLNVRSGPDLKFNVICQLSEEDEVTVAKTSSDGKWAGIVPPETAYLCIHEDLVDKIGGPQLFAERIKKAKELEGRMQKVELKYRVNMRKPPEEVPFDELITEYEAIAAGYPEFKDESATASKRIEELKNLKAEMDQKIAVAHINEAVTGDGPVIESDPPDEKDFVARYLTSKGKLVPAGGKAGEEGYMKIMKGRDVLCVVRSDVILLKLYKNKSVQVWGSEEYSATWEVPVIKATRIEELK